MERDLYIVFPRKKKWVVHRSGMKRATKILDDKGEAVALAISLCLSCKRDSCLSVNNRDATVDFQVRFNNLDGILSLG